MSEDASGWTPLFIDTGALFAYYNANDTGDRHARARSVFGGIQAGDLAYRPLLTSQFVLAELATLLRRKVGHTTAVNAVSDIRTSPAFTICRLDEAAFGATCEHFEQYADQQISFIDHSSAVLAQEHDAEHVFAFDQDFVTLGLTRVPVDTGEV